MNRKHLLSQALIPFAAACLIAEAHGTGDSLHEPQPGTAMPTATAAPATAGAALTPYTYLHHAVSTAMPAAQFCFDRGLTLVLAYDNEEAEVAFREAARLDPALAMAWWGIALALGPNINVDPSHKNTRLAADALARSRELAAAHATPIEREYIEALSARYTSDPHPDFDRLAVAYREAMRSLVRAHPEDADAAALYGEAIMDLHPWRLWSADGEPGPDTVELVEVLEQGLARSPDHLGLLHLYIHAVEASSDPGRALPVARRLSSLPMEPAAAHLVHMPAHIYLRVGDWGSAIEANVHSIHHALQYRLSSDPALERACGHCVDFLTYAYMMDGEEQEAKNSARDFQQLSKDPSNAIAVLVRFHEWDEMLAFPEPASDLRPFDHDVHTVRALWHYGRGLSFAAKSRARHADEELEALRTEAALAPPAPTFGATLDVEHSGEKLMQAWDAGSLQISAAILRARIAQAHGQLVSAAESLREAVRAQDALPYGEPPVWPYPVRESLGAMLLKQHSASEAETTFREGLRRSPHNPRLLLGLSESLRAQGRIADAAQAEREFRAAWRGRAEPKAADL
jgi:tetratricopeptide (TPR) repeat protein